MVSISWHHQHLQAKNSITLELLSSALLLLLKLGWYAHCYFCIDVNNTYLSHNTCRTIPVARFLNQNIVSFRLYIMAIRRGVVLWFLRLWGRQEKVSHRSLDLWKLNEVTYISRFNAHLRQHRHLSATQLYHFPSCAHVYVLLLQLLFFVRFSSDSRWLPLVIVWAPPVFTTPL